MDKKDEPTLQERAITEAARLAGVTHAGESRAMKAGIKAGKAFLKAIGTSTSEDVIAKATAALNREREATVAREVALWRLDLQERAITEAARLAGVTHAGESRAMKAGIKAGKAFLKAIGTSTSEDVIAKATAVLNRELEGTVVREGALSRLDVPESQVPQAKAKARLDFMIGVEIAKRQHSAPTTGE